MMKKGILLLILAVVLTFSLAAPAFAALTTTSAPPSKPWYTDAAEDYGYQEVFGDAFEPGRPVTRLEFARLLQKAFDIPQKSTSSNHSDDILQALYDAGILSDITAFNPDGILDRATMVHWVIKTLDYLTGGQYAIILIMPAPFDDDALIPDAYREHVTKAVILKLIYGRGNNIFAPLEGATCAEAVVIVSRLAALAETLIPDVTVRAGVSRQDDSLVMTLSLKNNKKETVVIHHPSMQRYDFKLFDIDGNLLYTWSLGRMFGLVLGTTEIAPGETLTYTEVLEGNAYNEIQDKVAYMAAFISGTSEDFVILEDGYTAYLPD
jgi:hypothetical protein